MKRTLDIKARFAILLGCFALGFVLYGAWSLKVLREIRVNGPIYQHIIQSKDLVADILPPPEYIIESYLVAYQLLDTGEHGAREKLLQRMQALKADYDARHQFWLEQSLEPDLRQAFLHDAHAPAAAFYEAAEREFLPAVRGGDRPAAEAAMRKLHGHYEQHRRAVDRVVEMANQRVARDEAAAREGIASANWQLAAILIAAMAAGVGVATQILRKLFQQLGGDPAVAAGLAGRIAAGDLTVGIALRPGDNSSLLYAMQGMRENLAQLVSRARSATDAISTASAQIASGNQDLASRTSSQAGALEQTASSMQGLTETVAGNAVHARRANDLADAAAETARRGGAVVGEVVQTMGSINASSRRIADIIGVIDGIAFQTNILALNAAVEAARAGEHGRGFAVVASEVRGLAQRSAGAAKEIKALIEDSVQHAEAGSRLADQAGTTMQEVVASIERVAGIMGEITHASHQQSGGIAQVHQAISDMDSATQQNAALVEEAAAAAASMHEQAGQLVEVVSVFRVATGAAPMAPPLRRAA
jgi:methyl-accepting chemotaxis protein